MSYPPDPRPAPTGWPSAEVAELAARISECHRREDALIAQQAERALHHWDADRRAEVETLAAGLARKPIVTLVQLRQSFHGCELLIDRWLQLAEVHAEAGRWTAAQRKEALDLLAFPRELHSGVTPLDPDPNVDPVEAIRVAVQAELDRLRARRESYRSLDAIQRQAARDGLGPDTPARTALRREETALFRQLQAASPRLPRRTPSTAASASAEPFQPLGHDRVMIERQGANLADRPPAGLLRVVSPEDFGQDSPGRHDPDERQADGPSSGISTGGVKKSQRLDPDVQGQPGLLPQFPQRADLAPLVNLQETARQRPTAGERLLPPLHQQKVRPTDAPSGEDDQVHRDGGPRVRVTILPFHQVPTPPPADGHLTHSRPEPRPRPRKPTPRPRRSRQQPPSDL